MKLEPVAEGPCCYENRIFKSQRAKRDGEVGALVQRGVAWEGDAHSIVMMGGVGPIEDQPTTLTEVPIRGFWRFYSELMGLKVEGRQ